MAINLLSGFYRLRLLFERPKLNHRRSVNTAPLDTVRAIWLERGRLVVEAVWSHVGRRDPEAAHSLSVIFELALAKVGVIQV